MVAIAAILIGLISNWSVIGRTVVGCGRINTGGIRRREVEGEVVTGIAAGVAAGAAVVIVWFIACGGFAKDY